MGSHPRPARRGAGPAIVLTAFGRRQPAARGTRVRIESGTDRRIFTHPTRDPAASAAARPVVAGLLSRPRCRDRPGRGELRSGQAWRHRSGRWGNARSRGGRRTPWRNHHCLGCAGSAVRRCRRRRSLPRHAPSRMTAQTGRGHHQDRKTKSSFHDLGLLPDILRAAQGCPGNSTPQWHACAPAGEDRGHSGKSQPEPLAQPAWTCDPAIGDLAKLGRYCPERKPIRVVGSRGWAPGPSISGRRKSAPKPCTAG
jgi:hypothetical protein